MSVVNINNTCLHPEATTVSFRFKTQLSKVFCNVLHLYAIDYISINIIDPQGQIICFSSHPSFEHNFFTDPIFEFDHIFSPIFYQNKPYYNWQDAFEPTKKETLTLLKLKKYNFNHGHCFIRQINDFFFIYSIASKEKNISAQYYSDNKPEILEIGDFCYRKIRPLYNIIFPEKIAPHMPILEINSNKKNYLTLVKKEAICH